MKNGSNYAFDRKPKDNPGPMRAIANEKKNLQGVISHNGEAGNPNAGRFHRAVLGNTQPGPPGVDRYDSLSFTVN